MDTTRAVTPRYLVRITSGEHAGRFVGFKISGGLVTNPKLHRDPPIPIEGTEFSSWADTSPNNYFEAGARDVQAKLQAAGYTSELVPYAG
jgi:hypothetical protein